MKIPFSAYDFFGYLASGFLVLAAVDFAFDGGWVLVDELPISRWVLWVVVAYVTGHVVAHISSALLEQGLVRKVLRSPEETLFAEQRRGGWARLFPGFYRPFPKETQRRVLDRAKAAGIAMPGRGLFFHCHPKVIQVEVVQERLSAFLNLYGFCRNLCLAAVLAIPILAAGFALREPAPAKLWWSGVAAAAAVGLLYRYLKFFKHYTMEVFRAYAELPADR